MAVNTKALLRVGAAVATALALTACGGGKVGDTPGGGSQSNAANKKLVLIPGVKAEPFYISMQCGAQEQAKKLGYELDTQAPDKFDAGMQTPIVSGIRATNPGGVLIAPTNATAMAAPIKQLKDAGIKVVEVDTKLEDRTIGVSAISSNNKQGGELAAKTLAKLIGEKGKVLVVSDKAGVSTTEARAKGFAEAIKAFPNIQQVGLEFTDNEPSVASQKISATLAAHSDLAGVFATNLQTGEGAAAGLRNAGKQGAVKLVGFDASPKQIDGLKGGEVQALIAQDPAAIGQQGVEQAVAAIEGKTVKKEIETELVAITKDDMAQKEKYFYKTKC